MKVFLKNGLGIFVVGIFEMGGHGCNQIFMCYRVVTLVGRDCDLAIQEEYLERGEV